MGSYQPGYDAPNAFFSALYRRSQSRYGTRKLVPGSPLFDHVANQIRAGWSPLQIAGRLPRMEPDISPGTVSHETIYTAAAPHISGRHKPLGF